MFGHPMGGHLRGVDLTGSHLMVLHLTGHIYHMSWYLVGMDPPRPELLP
jgi:hypothetical protein